MQTLIILSFIACAFAVTCKDNQYWDQTAKECKNCQGCKTCWSATKCTSCEEDYIIDSTYKCVKKEQNVENCYSYDGNYCVECKNGTYLQGNKCHTCTLDGCMKCNMNKCFKCNEGLTLYELSNGTQSCIDCASPENDEKCGRCPLGKYFNITTLDCQPCREKCRRCTNSTNCYLCNENLALESPENPTSDCKSIDHCKQDHYYGNHCELCEDQYFVLNGKCEKCGDYCTRCVNKNQCVECEQGAKLNTDGTCKKVEHCKRSSDLIGCLECESGYFLNASALCQDCDTSCATCKDATTCFTCKANYYFTDKSKGKCEIMDTTTCEVADQYGCLHCKSEVDINTADTALREEFDKSARDILGISEGYDKVLSDLSQGAEKPVTWTDVKVGYYIPYKFNDEIGKVIYEQKCARCDVGCIICEHNSSWCTACNPGYQMTVDEEATAIYKSHFERNASKPKTANENGNADTNGTQIYKCLKINAKCASTTMGYCTECHSPNFLAGMNCETCDISCGSCTKSEFCQTCNVTEDANGDSSYFRPKYYSDLENAAKGHCLQLNETTRQNYSLYNCKDKISASGCQTCQDGYYRSTIWGGCKKCPKECVTCEMTDENFEKDFDSYKRDNSGDANFFSHFKCKSCKPASGGFAGEILRDDKCLPCNTIEHCVKCGGTEDSCQECASSYTLQDGKCKISDLVIALPIVSVVAVIVIIIIIVIIIFVYKDQKKKRAERDKEIKPFKVSSEVEMALLSADNENFPLETDMWELKFGLEKNKAIVDTEYKQTVNIANRTKRSYFFEVLAGASHKYELTAEPMRYTLKPGMAIQVEFTIKMLCTTVVSDDIGIVAMDMDEEGKETAKMTIMIESDLSMKLDHTELKLEMPAIGEGAFGMVFKGTYRGQKVAVKKMKARNLTEEQEKEFKHEVNMLTQYRHACVVNLVGAVYTEGEISIVTEFADYGSLSKVWGKQQVSYDLKVKFMEDAVVALSFLHENQIIHRDVKGENVLVYSLNPHSPVCGKLTDFGTCRNVSERALATKELTEGIGTPTYMAPECLGNNKYDIRADVYSFGIVLYETYIEKNAYDDDERFNQPWMIPQFVIEGKRLDKPKGIPNDYWALVEKCWQQDPENRPTFPQVYSTLAALSNINIAHTETSNKGEKLDIPAVEEQFEEGGSSSSSSSSSSEEEE